MNFPKLAVEHPIAATMVILAMCIAGAAAWASLSIDLFPNIDFPVAFVQTPYPGVDPTEMENIVTRKIEEEVNTVSGIKTINSHSFEGFSWIIVEFVWGRNIDLGAVDLREKVDLAKRKLPRDIEQVTVAKLDINAQPVLNIALGGDYDAKALRTLADREIKPAFERLGGVANVEVLGGLEREIRVKVIPEKLKSCNLTINDIIGAVGNDNRNTPVGNIVEGNFKYLVRAEGEFKTPQALGNIIVKTVNGRPIYLGDVAMIVDGYKEIESVSRLNAKTAVTLAIKKEAGANPVAISDAAKKLIPKLEARYQGRLKITIGNDSSDFIRDSLEMVRENAIVGAWLSIIVLFLFFKNIRSTIIIGLSIPLAVVITFGFMFLKKGMTLNLLTLGGLALGIGMMVDNAIVVLENTYRHLLKRGDAERAECAIFGANEVMLAILALTLTHCAVFLPIGLVPGVVGEIFMNMSLAIIFSMVASFIVAIGLIPMLCAKALKAHDPLVQGTKRFWHWVHGFLFRRWDDANREAAARGAAEVTVALVGGLALTAPLLMSTQALPAAVGTVEWLIVGAGWAAIGLTKFVVGFVDVVLVAIGKAILPASALVPLGKMHGGLVAAWPGLAGAVKGLLAAAHPSFLSGLGMLVNAAAGFLVALPVAILLSLFVIPFVAVWVHRHEPESEDVVMDAVCIVYGIVLQWLLRRSWRRYLYVFVVMLVFFKSFSFMPAMEFFPDMDRGIFVIKIETPEGTSIESTDVIMTRIEALTQALPETDRIIAQTKMAEGQVTVVLHPVEKRKRNIAQLVEVLRPEIEKIPGILSLTFSKPKMGGPEGSNKPIQIEVSGDDYAVINQVAEDISGRIKNVPGLRDISSGVKLGRPEVKIDFDREKVRDLGKDPLQVAGMVRSYVFGTLAGTYKEANEEYDIRVEAVDDIKDQIAKIRALEIVLDDDKVVKLEQIAKVYEGRGISKVRRKNLKRVVAVEADIADRPLQAVVNDVNDILKQMTLPTGYAYNFGGEEEERREAFGNLFLALIGSLLLVYMIMAAQFESLAQPFVIMFTIPLGVIGVILGLRVMGFAFSITAMIGIIMLAGIVLSNGIILIDYINRRREQGKDKLTATVDSGKIRLRPIVMTTLTTALGMLPLSLGIGAGSDFYQPLAITVIGGLTMSTILTLTFIPSLYIMVDDFVEFLQRKIGRYI